jgi:hypothetical protein
LILAVIWIDQRQIADPGDGPAQPDQLLTVELIGAAEVVDDFGDGFAVTGMAFVVGQLEIFDDRAVLVLRFVVRSTCLRI